MFATATAALFSVATQFAPLEQLDLPTLDHATHNITVQFPREILNAGSHTAQSLQRQAQRWTSPRIETPASKPETENKPTLDAGNTAAAKSTTWIRFAMMGALGCAGISAALVVGLGVFIRSKRQNGAEYIAQIFLIDETAKERLINSEKSMYEYIETKAPIIQRYAEKWLASRANAQSSNDFSNAVRALHTKIEKTLPTIVGDQAPMAKHLWSAKVIEWQQLMWQLMLGNQEALGEYKKLQNI